MSNDPTLQQDLAQFETQASEGAMKRLESFRAPRPKSPLVEGEVEVLADALESAVAYLSGGEVQRGGSVAFEVDAAMERGKLSKSLFAGLSALSSFIEAAREDNPELGRYAFDPEDVATDREAMLDAIGKLGDLQEDQRALMRMRAPVRSEEPEPEPEPEPDPVQGLLED